MQQDAADQLSFTLHAAAAVGIGIILTAKGQFILRHLTHLIGLSVAQQKWWNFIRKMCRSIMNTNLINSSFIFSQHTLKSF